MEEDRVIITQMAKEVHKALTSLMEVGLNKKQRGDIVENAVRSALRKVLKHEVGKAPAIEVELVYMA